VLTADIKPYVAAYDKKERKDKGGHERYAPEAGHRTLMYLPLIDLVKEFPLERDRYYIRYEYAGKHYRHKQTQKVVFNPKGHILCSINNGNNGVASLYFCRWKIRPPVSKVKRGLKKAWGTELLECKITNFKSLHKTTFPF
jgi:hypothetical protein